MLFSGCCWGDCLVTVLSWPVPNWPSLSVFILYFSLLSRLCSIKQSFKFPILSIVKKEMFPSYHIQSLNLSAVTQRCCDILPIKRPTANIAKLSPSQTHNHLISCQTIKRPTANIYPCKSCNPNCFLRVCWDTPRYGAWPYQGQGYCCFIHLWLPQRGASHGACQAG